mgnify:CR=1 FL=1
MSRLVLGINSAHGDSSAVLVGERGVLAAIAEERGYGFGLGFAVTLDPATTGIPGSAGDFYWGGMFSTGFFVDPVEEICMVFMTQLMPSSTYPVRREVKTLVHAAIGD